MELTPRRLNRATLARQLLLEREPLPVAEAVRRIVVVQAQEPASPYLALWNRVAGFEPDDLDDAFACYDVVKATLLRITLHAVHVEDYPSFHHAMAPSLRASRLNDRRFTETGLTAADADALVDDLLAFAAEPRRNPDVEAWIEQRLGAAASRAWWALRTYAPVVHAPSGATWSHGPRPAYVAAPVGPASGDPGPSAARLVRRYLEGFGPATAKDIAQGTILRAPVVAAALAELGAADDPIVTVPGPGGAVLHDVAGGALPAEDVPAPPRLMAMWDSSLLAYFDRGRIIPVDLRPLVIRRNGDVLPTVLVDGFVAGLWRPADGGRGIEVTAFHRLTATAWRQLAAEAASLLALLAGRDTAVYRRYAHWWDQLPAGEVRVLDG